MKYEIPLMEILDLDEEDVVTASNGLVEGTDVPDIDDY